MNLERLPPHSSESEKAILGCIVIDPSMALNVCRAAFKDPEVFYDLRHREIYTTICNLCDTGRGLDVITLHQALKDAGKLEQVGGTVFVAGLADDLMTHQLPHYLAIVLEKHLLRKMIAACTNAVTKIYEQESDAQGLLDELEREILAVRGHNMTAMPPIKELVSRALTQIEKYHEAQGQVTGIPTGFADYDHMTGGLPECEMIVICGYPGAGKTALAVNIAENVVLKSGIPVGVFSMEMSGTQLVLRMLSSQGKVNMRRVRGGHMVEGDFSKLTVAASSVAKAALYIDDSSDLTVHQLRAKARRMVQQWGVRLIVVDYLQLLGSGGGSRKPDSRQEEVAEISRGLKLMAQELKLPVIALCQLNDDGRLRESRAIGQDADTVCRLKIEPGKEDAEPCPVTLEIIKQRNGPTGKIDLLFLKSYTRFESASPVRDAEAPEGKYPYSDI